MFSYGRMSWSGTINIEHGVRCGWPTPRTTGRQRYSAGAPLAGFQGPIDHLETPLAKQRPLSIPVRPSRWAFPSASAARRKALNPRKTLAVELKLGYDA